MRCPLNFVSESFAINTMKLPLRRSTFVPHCFADPLWLDCDSTDLIAPQGPQNISTHLSLPRSLLTFSQHSLPQCISPSAKRHNFPDPSLHKFCLPPICLLMHSASLRIIVLIWAFQKLSCLPPSHHLHLCLRCGEIFYMSTIGNILVCKLPPFSVSQPPAYLPLFALQTVAEWLCDEHVREAVISKPLALR